MLATNDRHVPETNNIAQAQLQMANHNKITEIWKET